MDYYEVSAKTDEGIDQAMNDLTEQCLAIISKKFPLETSLMSSSHPYIYEKSNEQEGQGGESNGKSENDKKNLDRSSLKPKSSNGIDYRESMTLNAKEHK